MFNNLLKYYLQNTQIRINKRIEAINAERMILKASGDKKYKGLKAIKNTHLYENKPKIIKDIRESEANILAEKLSITVAESLKDNIKLKPDFKTKSSIKFDEIKMKKDNLEFVSLQELLWGLDESFTEKDKFRFILNLFLDLENNTEYSSLVREILIDYIPFAKYAALEKAVNEDSNFGSLFVSNYKNSNIDVFAEAVYAFCKTIESDEIMVRFTEFLRTPYTYESKDRDGRFLIKTGVVHFQNFAEAFGQILEEIVKPIMNTETHNSLGKRAYDIILSDYKIDSDLMNFSMVRSPESYGHYLTASERPDTDAMFELWEASESYIEKLIQTQQDFNGDIEQEYFESDLFLMNGTPYYSEDRFIQLLEQKRMGEFEEEYFSEIEGFS